jgi:DNA repair protein RAD5
MHEAAMKRLENYKAKKTKEVVGDGEEIEVDDAENLSTNEIDSIYKRSLEYFLFFTLHF